MMSSNGSAPASARLAATFLRPPSGNAEMLFVDLPTVLLDYLRLPPKLPESRGVCWAVLVNQQPAWLPLLRPARALPLRWQEGAEHDRHLPASLLSLADQVLATLRKTENLPGSWGLVPGPRGLLEEHDLSGVAWGLRFGMGAAGRRPVVGFVAWQYLI